MTDRMWDAVLLLHDGARRASVGVAPEDVEPRSVQLQVRRHEGAEVHLRQSQPHEGEQQQPAHGHSSSATLYQGGLTFRYQSQPSVTGMVTAQVVPPPTRASNRGRTVTLSLSPTHDRPRLGAKTSEFTLLSRSASPKSRAPDGLESLIRRIAL